MVSVAELKMKKNKIKKYNIKEENKTIHLECLFLFVTCCQYTNPNDIMGQ